MKRLFFLIVTFGTAFINAQQENRIGLLPSFNLRYSINEEWKTNMKIESRFLQFDMKQDSSDFQFYNLTDISFFIGKKYGSIIILLLGIYSVPQTMVELFIALYSSSPQFKAGEALKVHKGSD